MTDIFISYSRKDVELASTLARTLEELGYSVWWDVSGLHGGQSFAQVIQQKLDEAKCAIVVWSPDSAVSGWVHSEASFADNRGILLTAVYRETQAPMPFNNRHNENLRGWNGNVFDEDFQKLLKAVHRLCPVPNGAPRSTANVVPNKPAETPKKGISPTIKAAGLGALALAMAAGVYVLLPPPPEPITISTATPTDLQTVNQPLLTAPAASAAKDTQASVAVPVEQVSVTTAAEPAKVERVASSKVYKLANNLTLLPIPIGSFMMGSDSGSSNERPAHQVTIDKPFWMSKTEITFDQYDTYAKAAGKSLPDDEKWGRGTRPVINVSWDDAQAYVQWLSANNSQGLQCRLPSEAEWEYAARAGATTKYPWGDMASHEQANYGTDACCKGLVKGRDQWIDTSPVGSFPENQWGLQDMHGNVWEWVQDPWHNDYNGAPYNGDVWEKDGDVSRRVLRGGSWLDTPGLLRSADRYYVTPDGRVSFIGFRVVCSPPSVR